MFVCVYIYIYVCVFCVFSDLLFLFDFYLVVFEQKVFLLKDVLFALFFVQCVVCLFVLFHCQQYFV